MQEEKKIVWICSACEAENLKKFRMPPKNKKEEKQVNFICDSCGRKNLRDGSVPGFVIDDGQEKVQEDGLEEQEQSNVSKDDQEPQGTPKKKEGEGWGLLFILGGVATLIFSILTGRKK